jgi:NADH-quinone oxidoreductase subunit K
MITPQHYLLLGSFLFIAGVVVVATRKQTTVVLMGMGLMLNAVNLMLVALTSWFQDWSGQVAALVIVTIAAVELTAGFSFAQAYTRSKEQKNDKDN